MPQKRLRPSEEQPRGGWGGEVSPESGALPTEFEILLLIFLILDAYKICFKS